MIHGSFQDSTKINETSEELKKCIVIRNSLYKWSH